MRVEGRWVQKPINSAQKNTPRPKMGIKTAKSEGAKKHHWGACISAYSGLAMKILMSILLNSLGESFWSKSPNES